MIYAHEWSSLPWRCTFVGLVAAGLWTLHFAGAKNDACHGHSPIAGVQAPGLVGAKNDACHGHSPIAGV
eukprot:1142153-Pelagomonas_calceolata.AAC.4